MVNLQLYVVGCLSNYCNPFLDMFLAISRLHLLSLSFSTLLGIQLSVILLVVSSLLHQKHLNNLNKKLFTSSGEVFGWVRCEMKFLLPAPRGRRQVFIRLRKLDKRGTYVVLQANNNSMKLVMKFVGEVHIMPPISFWSLTFESPLAKICPCVKTGQSSACSF